MTYFIISILIASLVIYFAEGYSPLGRIFLGGLSFTLSLFSLVLIFVSIPNEKAITFAITHAAEIEQKCKEINQITLSSDYCALANKYGAVTATKITIGYRE